MSVAKGCLIAVFALIAGSLAEKARADEAYVCEGGRIAYVKPGELENKKRTDPCVARYFDVPSVAAKAKHQPQAAAAASVPEVGSATERVSEAQAIATRATESAPDQRKVRIINATSGSAVWFQVPR